jgi:hypothetical protein
MFRVFWEVAPCSDEVDRRFRGDYTALHTFYLFYFPNTRNHVSLPYKVVGKFGILINLLFFSRSM